MKSSTEKNKHRKIKWKNLGVLLLFLFIIVWIIIGIYLLNHKSVDKKLEEQGYNKNEILSIRKYISEKDLEILLDYSYHETILHILEEENFQEENLKKYLDFLKRYPLATSDDVVFLINRDLEDITYTPDIHTILHHKDFKEEYLSQYLEYYQKNAVDGNQVILDINNKNQPEKPKEPEDKNESSPKEDVPTVEDNTSLFLGREYTIQKNLSRYNAYYQKHKDLDIDEIITRVNSNLDKEFYVDTTPTDLSKGDLIIANKYYYLGKDYVPDNLVSINSTYGNAGQQVKEVAYNAFIEMYNAALKENLHLYISSPYRSYSRQSTLYNNYVKRDGKKEADTYSARPGFSEHQTGLAMDLSTASNHSIDDFEKSKEFTWTVKHAYEYGFILRYPKGKEYITGYIYEPWHYRYVGKEVAKYIYEHDITYEEYYEFFVK